MIGAINPIFSSRGIIPIALPHAHAKVAKDAVYFGKKTQPVEIIKPELDLIPWHSAVPVPIVTISTAKPPAGEDSLDPSKSDVFKITFDITDTNLVDQTGNPRIGAGQHLRIKADIPDTAELRYLDSLQYTRWRDAQAQVKDPAHLRYLTTRRYSVANVEKRPDGRVWLSLTVRRLEYEKDGSQVLGLVSNQMANKKPGDLVKITGPDNDKFTPPPRAANLLVFTTGIASHGPIEFIMRTRLDSQKGKLGRTRVYAGYRTQDDEMARSQYTRWTRNPFRKFFYDVAFSRDSKNPQHIQDLIERDADKVLSLLLNENTYAYFCGVRDVEDSVRKKLLEVAEARGIREVVEGRIDEMRTKGQWRVEGVRSPLAKNT